MATIVSNLLKGERIREDDEGGGATVIYHVEGLSASLPKDNKLFTAVDLPGIPKLLDPHPRNPNFAVQARDAIPVEDSPEQADIEITYRALANVKFGYGIIPGVRPPVISVGSTLRTVETNKSVTGEQFLIRHWFRNQTFNVKSGEVLPAEGDAFRGGVVIELASMSTDTATGIVTMDINVEQAGVITIQVPFTTVSYSRAERGSPGSKAKLYVGKINKDRAFGDPPHFWLCTRIDGNSRDGGSIYDVVYEFQRNPDTWNPDLAFFDPELGGMIPGAAIENARIYHDISFRRLNLGVGISGIRVGL